MPEYLTIKQAMAATGKSRSSIRGIVEPIRDDENHPDKDHIKRIKSGGSMVWHLSEELLFRHYQKLDNEPVG